MTDFSRSQRMIAEKTVCVLLVRGQDPSGEPIYAYVAVRTDKLQEFIAAQQSDTFYPEDYGVIIEAGQGEPTPEVRAHMETEYGFNHDAMKDIPSVNRAGEVAKEITQTLQDEHKNQYDA